MIRFIKTLLFGGALLFLSNIHALESAAHFPLQWKDASDRKVTIPQRPERVISLAPSLTEFIFALSADDRLVADTKFCLEPPAARQKPKIGGLADPNLEAMKHLNPDLVLCTPLTPKDVVRAMEVAGFNVIVFDHKGMDGVRRDIQSLGKILETEKKASEILQDWEKRTLTLQQRLQNLPRLKTLLLYDQDGLYSAGKGSFPDDLIALAGGQNVAANAEGAWPQLSMGKIIAWNPDVILFVSYHDDVSQDRTRAGMQALQKDPRWKTISAVKNNRIVVIDYTFLSVPGAKMMDAVEIIAQAIHPK